jgi:hypothetical protein
MATNDSAISCSNSTISIEELLMAALDTDSSGKPTLRLYESAEINVNFVSCAKKNANIQELAKQLFTLNASGKIALRVSITP